jgi:cytochrome c-type protein NapB
MRGSNRKGLRLVLTAAALLIAGGCGDGDWAVGSSLDVAQSPAGERAARRAYDGAPPVVPHEDFGMTCGACHDEVGMPLEGVGFAPASPHDGTAQAYSTQRCRQCHVFSLVDGLFVDNDFVGLAQDLRAGGRLYDGAPPTMPHKVLMRENCAACHTGPGARAEIATSHPERDRCTQCHVAVTTQERFSSAAGRDLTDQEGS